METQSSESSASPSESEDDTSRLHIRGIKEMPVGHDQELAIIFSEMRRAVNIPREKMAGRLATSDETLDALESGAIFALPPWPELSRIVTAYATMLGLDSRPLLRRLEAQLFPDGGLSEVSPPQKEAPKTAAAIPMPAPGAPQATRPEAPPVPPSAASPVTQPAQSPRDDAPPPIEAKAPAQPLGDAQFVDERVQPQYRMESDLSAALETPVQPKRKPGVLKSIINWLLLISFVAALGAGVWYAAQRPQMVWSALDSLPDPIPQAVRSTWKFMRPLEGKAVAPQINDAENRKSDKLP